MLTIKVLPNKPSAKILKHPDGPVLGDGALWPNDSFTARRLTDKSIVRAPAEPEAHAGPEKPATL